MPKLYGYTGKILRIDLTREKISEIEIEPEIYRKFLGGQTLGLYFLFKEGVHRPEVDPFSPENLWQIVLGPLNGMGPSNRSCIVTKSPWGFACITYRGGRTAMNLRLAGWDGLQLVGRAKDPVYIKIVDDKVELCDARELWGKTTEEVELKLLREALAPHEYRPESFLTDDDLPPGLREKHKANPKIGIGAKRLGAALVIGPMGENLVWMATVMTDGYRASGRYGAGAILGSKRVKGIVIRGTKGHKVADKTEFLAAIREIWDAEKKSFLWRLWGTSFVGERASNLENGFPIRNWQYCAWEDPRAVRALSGMFMDTTGYIKMQACPGCLLKCAKTHRITSADPMLDGKVADHPDWEAMGMVGGNLGYVFPEEGKFKGLTPADPYPGDHRDAMEALAKTTYTTWLWDVLGGDWIEGGALIAMLMELRQRGLITPEDLDGIDLKWGDVHAVDAITRKIVKRDGIGDILARGAWETAKYFAEKKGKPEIMNYAIVGRKYAQPAHGARSSKEFTACYLSYMTAIRPCEHTDGGGGFFRKGDYEGGVKNQYRRAAAFNSTVTCYFPNYAGYTYDLVIRMVRAATGWKDFSDQDLLDIGARAYAMARLFNLYSQNIKDPLTEWDSIYPWARWTTPLPTGPTKGDKVDKDKAYEELKIVWRLRGWTEDKGVPTKETLEKLGIWDVVKEAAQAYL